MTEHEPFPENGRERSVTRVTNPRNGGGAVELPHSIEAEQALLGAMLIHNDVLGRVTGMVTEESFFEALHARIFAAVGELIAQGMSASPVTLATYFKHDSAMQQVGGPAYLARLAASAVATPHALDYARAIRDMAVRRDLIHTAHDMLAVAEDIPVDQSVDSVIANAEERLYALRPAYGGKAAAEAAPIHTAGAQALENLRKAKAGEGVPLQRTGLPALDRLIGGLEPGVVTILAGRPSMGKSSVAIQMAMHCAGIRFGTSDGWSWHDDAGAVHFQSLEMTRVQMARRMHSALSWLPRPDIDTHDPAGFAGVPYEQIRKAYVTDERMPWLDSAQDALSHMPLWVDERRGVGVPYIAQAARRTARKAEQKGQPLKLLIIDHLTLIRDSGRWRDNRSSAVGEIVDSLTTLARDMGIPVLVLAQLSRNVESRDNKRPILSDLRESGEIEEHARTVMFVYRDEYYLKQREPDAGSIQHQDWEVDMEASRGLVELNVAKMNEGETGVVKMRGHMPYGVFTDLPVLGGDR